MKRIIISLPYRMLIIFLVMINGALFGSGLFISNQMEEKLVGKHKETLLSFARVLDNQLGPGGFDEILLRADATNALREEKIRILRDHLSPFTDRVANSQNGLGIGYYSLDLDSMITYGPSRIYGDRPGLPISQDHPGRQVMARNEVMVVSGKMVRGEIMNAMVPINRGGRVIGYIWANELVSEITALRREMRMDLYRIMGVAALLSIGFLVFFSRGMVRDVRILSKGVERVSRDFRQRIPDNGGTFSKVVQSINGMAERVEQATAESQRSVEMLQNVMSNVESSIYVCDPATKRLVYVNNLLAGYLGRHDLAGMICHKAIYNRPDPCPFCPQPLLFSADGTPQFTPMHRELQMRARNAVFYVSDSLVKWNDGRVLHMEVATDISDRRVRLQVEKTEENYRDFLICLGDALSHPVKTIIGKVHEAQNVLPPNSSGLDALDSIHDQSRQLLESIHDITEYINVSGSKAVPLAQKPFSLRDMLEDVLAQIRPMLSPGVELEMKCAPDVPDELLGDARRITQVLRHLLVNAAQHTFSGKVGVHVMVVNINRDSLRLKFSVSDTGEGIEKGMLPQLFQPFIKDAQSGVERGVGLGLPICKELVRRMQGNLQVESRQGEGTTFSFQLSLLQDMELKDLF